MKDAGRYRILCHEYKLGNGIRSVYWIADYTAFQLFHHFLCTSLFAAFSLVASLFMYVPEGEKGGASPQKGFKISDYFEKRALPISIFIGFAGFTYSSILSYLTSFAKEMDLMDAASFFFVVFAVFLLASRPFTGRMFDVKGENAVIYPSLILFAVGMVILSQSHHGITLLIAGAFIGVGYGTFQSSCQAISIKEAPSNRMGLATSTFLQCMTSVLVSARSYWDSLFHLQGSKGYS